MAREPGSCKEGAVLGCHLSHRAASLLSCFHKTVPCLSKCFGNAKAKKIGYCLLGPLCSLASGRCWISLQIKTFLFSSSCMCFLAFSATGNLNVALFFGIISPVPDLISSLSFLPAGLQGQTQLGWGGEGRWGYAARSHLVVVAKPSLHIQSTLANTGSAGVVEFWPWSLIHENSPDFCMPCCIQDRQVSRAPCVQHSPASQWWFCCWPCWQSHCVI